MITGEKEQFLAFLTTFNQGFSSTWNQESVFGRNDDIATFQGTKRSLSIAWDVPSINDREAQGNLDRCSNLIQMLYPFYSQGQSNAGGVTVSSNALSLSKAPLVRIKFANLVSSANGERGLLGYITSLSWNPVLEMGMFATPGKFFPKVITISIEFTPLHEHTLGTSTSGTPFGGAAKFPFKG